LKSAFLFCILFFLVSCQTLPKSFLQEEGVLRHQQTGLVLPLEIPGWMRKGEVVENISPEIMAAVSYQFVSEAKQFQPYATVYVLKNKSTANLTLIENRGVPSLENAQLFKTETTRLKSKIKVQIRSYHQMAELKDEYNQIKLKKEFPTQSFFLQSLAERRLVFWITTEKGPKSERDIALQFVDAILLKNKAK
jgi:hypothetical protein